MADNREIISRVVEHWLGDQPSFEVYDTYRTQVSALARRLTSLVVDAVFDLGLRPGQCEGPKVSPYIEDELRDRLAKALRQAGAEGALNQLDRKAAENYQVRKQYDELIGKSRAALLGDAVVRDLLDHLCYDLFFGEDRP